MKWIEIEGTHINTNNVKTFFWENGMLVVWWGDDTVRTEFPDPARKFYLKMCRNLGILPFNDTDKDNG